MKIIGFKRVFSYDNSYEEIPKFWKEFCEKYCRQDRLSSQVEEETRQTIAECAVGEFGVCIEEGATENQFDYYIAGAY